jgi:hypothetical protein
MWNRIASRIITNRTESEHIFQLFRIGRHHNNNNNNNRNNPEIHLSEGLDFSFISDCFETFEEKVKNIIRNELYCCPQLVIAFYGNFCPHSKRPERLMHYNCLRKYVWPKCQFLNVISSAGLIGSQLRSTNTSDRSSLSPIEPIETQAHVGNCAGISLILFPKNSSVEIDVFDDRNLIPLEKLNSRNDLKCLLVFATTCTEGKKDQFKEFNSINQLMRKYENRVALGGIIIDETNYFANNNSTTRKKSRDLYGLAFSGPNVRACSLVINTERQDLTEAKLRQFRSNLGFNPDIESCETIGFIFICTGRGIHTYQTSNVESVLFRKVFPNVKLIGVYGHGEYGHDYWPSITHQNLTQELVNSEEDNQSQHKFWRFYTTILVLINIPKK